MKKLIVVAALILAAMSCQKEPECTGAKVICTHKVFSGFQICPDSTSATGWTYSNINADLETVEMTDCDTTEWLAKTRAYDAAYGNLFPQDSKWKPFHQAFPNECGCE